MKRASRLLASIFVTFLLVFYFTMTPKGSLRFKLFLSGYPVAALTMQTKDEPNKMQLTSNQIGFSLTNAPYEEDTQAELINWVVTKHSIFYTAQYYGWG